MIRGPATCRNTRRRVLAVNATILGALTLTACGGAAAPAGQAPVPSKGPVTLRLHIQTGSYATWSAKWGDRFKQEHPNVAVAVEPIATANQEYFTKVKSMLVTNTLGDLVWTWCTQGLLAEFGHLNVWRAVDDLVKADKLDLGQYFPAVIEGEKYQGKLMGLPFHGHPGFPFFFYNAELFAKRGIAAPDDKWTLDTLLDAAKKLTVRDGSGPDQFGWFSQVGYHPLIIWARMFGGDLLSADGKKADVASPAAKAAVQWLVDARHKHRVDPQPEELGSQNVNDLFAAGRFAMQQGDSAQVSTMQTRIQGRFQWSIALLPPGPKTKAALTTPHIIGITSQSRAVADAWTFLKSYTNKEAGVDKALDGAGVPGGRADAWNDPRITGTVPQYKVLTRAFDYARPEIPPANFRGLEYSGAVDSELAPIFKGQEGVDSGLVRAAAAIQKVLDQAAG